MATIIRVFKLWGIYAYLDFIWMVRDFRHFFINIFAELIVNFFNVVGIFLLAERFYGLGTWSRLEIIFMLAYASVVTGWLAMFFSYNVLFISRRIGRGQLDHLLVQPQPLWLAFITEGFTPFSNSIGFCIGLGLLCWSYGTLQLPCDLPHLAFLALNLGASCVIVLAFSFVLGSAAFWAPRGAEEISTPAVELMETVKVFPLNGLKGVLGLILISILPAGLVAWYPAQTVIAQSGFSWSAYLTIITAFGFLAAAVLLFRLGLGRYRRKGAGRYLSFGHRR